MSTLTTFLRNEHGSTTVARVEFSTAALMLGFSMVFFNHAIETSTPLDKPAASAQPIAKALTSPATVARFEHLTAT